MLTRAMQVFGNAFGGNCMDYGIGFKHIEGKRVYFAHIPPAGTLVTANELEGPWSLMNAMDTFNAEAHQESLKQFEAQLKEVREQLENFFENLLNIKKATLEIKDNEFASGTKVDEKDDEWEISVDEFNYAAASKTW